MRRCAPTWPRGCPPPRPPPGSATRPRRCCRRCGTSAPGPGSSSLRRQARPEDRPGQGRRPAADHRAARRRARRSTRSPPRWRAEGTPLNRTGIAEVIAEEGLRPPAARRRARRPARRPGAGDPGPAPRPSTSPRCPRAPRPGWPGCCWPSPTWLPWTCRTWRLPRATRPRRGSRPCPDCCRCWRSS